MTSMEALISLSVCLSAATAYISGKPIFSNVETYLLRSIDEALLVIE